ncbi:hypothetical protein RHS01_11376 [Rhizoctonia solani]|uniref:Tet-like 2OG-Fe(II) oxygenase domain-containing protein n=1 Tax=Rhizoctonia solani TaxID=456999 RepID=A0A8H7I012_9AGAM|nr:hypothetical protein RHS01_11376 [Rhizoctonia solani]
MDANTHEKLDPRKMLIKGVDAINKELESASVSCSKSQGRADKQASVPPPVKDASLGDGFVDTKTVLADKRFKVLSHGTVYGFAWGSNQTYSMVFAVQFQSQDSLLEIEKEAVDVFTSVLPKMAVHAYEVRVNGAQSVGGKQAGHLYSVGWRPGTTHGERAAVYAAQNTKDKHDPTHYIDLYNSLELVNVSKIKPESRHVLADRVQVHLDGHGREPVSRAVLRTIDTLANTAVPMFGSQSSNIASHGPSLGSNMAASQHDQNGNGFANKMHVDRDMDSLPSTTGMFAFGQWIHVDKEGCLVENERIKAAIPDGLFVIPGYRIAFDLGAATIVKAIWHGGMDTHGTTTSKVDITQVGEEGDEDVDVDENKDA